MNSPIPGKRKALGRGLAALLPDADGPRHQDAPGSGGTAVAGAALRTVAIEDLHPSNAQPRKTFRDETLMELADSIRTQGIIQPLVVRARSAGGFDIIAGERRWRAAQKAGLHEVPVIVRDVVETRAFEMALVENLQREDLNPIEEADGFARLIQEFGYTQETLANRVGKDRSTVTNSLRLLKLPDQVRKLVVEDRLSMGHARALLGLETPEAMERLARKAVSRGLSVRAVETLVRRERDGEGDATAPVSEPSAAARDLSERLQRALGTRVRVAETAPGRGSVEIHYHSLDQLDGLLKRLLP